jgi:eukaryotic-like serine/threonine-protein kinase
LLAAHRTAAGVLDRAPPLPAEDPATDPDVALEDPLAGTALGPYLLQEVLGRGGMGVVFAAEQLRPVRRRVACKIIRSGLESREVVARFEAEREALALMSHGAIARVFDAGATTDGRPFFVMELIDGQPITAFCDARRLSVRERLELFAAVCDGVQHAHQKGVIHRDLKPSNVLVTLEGSRPVPKIIDFGIAKALHRPLTAEPLVTTLGQLVGTPVYMSPEQVAGRGTDVDTRSDIYALGVILYELLTGSVPFDAAVIATRGLAEFERLVRTQPADPPTVRLARDAVAGRVARAADRATTAGELLRLLRGDLDAIVLKALAKDRRERYATAAELGVDVHRFLGGEAVLARPPTRTYRLRKFVGRHRTGVAFAALLSVLVVTFAIVFGVQSVRLDRSLKQTAIERDRSSQVAAFLTRLFALADPDVSNGDTVTVRSVLDRGAAQIDSDLSAQPDTRAALLETMADAYRALGLYDRSAALIESALAARRAASDDHLGLASTLHVRGMLEKDRGELSGAERDYRAALALLDGAPDAKTADVVGDLATLLRDRGAYEEATRWAKRAVELRRSGGGDPSPELASSLLELARCYQLQGQRAAAAPLYEQGLVLMRRLLGDNHVRVAEALNGHSTLLRDDGRYTEAAGELRQALAIYRRVLGPRHSYVAANLVNVAGIEYYLSDYREAREHAAEALALYEQLFGPDSANVGPALLIVGNVAAALGDLPGAERALRRALAIDRRAEGGETADVAGDYEVLGTIVRDQGRLVEAADLHQSALELRLKVLGPQHPGTANSRASLGVDLALEGRTTEGAALVEAALAALRDIYGRPHVRIAAALYGLGRVRTWSQDLPGAETAQREALELRRQLLGESHADTAASESALADVLLGRDARVEAKRLYEQALAVRRSRLPPDHPDRAATELGLGAIRCAEGDLGGGRMLVQLAAARLRRALPPTDPRLRPIASAAARCAGPAPRG